MLNGNPFQYSCLDNPMDGGACWAAVYGVAQSRTRLMRLSSSSSMYGCKSWTIKKAEHRRVDAFELRCCRRLVLQGDPTSPSKKKSVLNIHWKDWSWSWNSNTLATWGEELTHLKRPWSGKDWRWGRWGRQRMRWTWVWVDSGSWWWTGRPGVLQSMGSQIVRHDRATELTDPYSGVLKRHTIN